jgi:hypothetical protein
LCAGTVRPLGIDLDEKRDAKFLHPDGPTFFQEPGLVDVVAALISLLTMVAFLKFWRSAILSVILLAPTLSLAEDTPRDWVKVTDRAGWQPRDSSGEIVYKDRLWLLGGWFESFAAPPRDVWSSTDGASWTLVTKEARGNTVICR